MVLPESLTSIIDAHGGEDRWRSLEAIEAVLSVRGFLFAMKRVPPMKHVRVRAWIREPRFTFFDFPRQGQNGEFMGDKEVLIADSLGNVVRKRLQPRPYFSGLRRSFYWDSLDFIYFGGYATWNYLLTPFLFLHDGFAFEEIGPVRGLSGFPTVLRTTFPEDIPTHCKTQTFYFDDQGLLRRLDYTAEVIGHWAHAAHLCDEYTEVDGLRFPTHRRVMPLGFGNKPLPGPTLVAIDVHEIRPIRAPSGSDDH